MCHPHPYHMLDKPESMVAVTQAAYGSGRPTSHSFEVVPSRGKEFIWSGDDRKSGNAKMYEAPFSHKGGKGYFFAARGTIV